MKIFVIDGTDGSGKETQARMLVERLNNIALPNSYVVRFGACTTTDKIHNIS